MRIKLATRKEDDKALLLLLTDDRGVISKAYLSTMFKDSTLEEIKVLMSGAATKEWKQPKSSKINLENNNDMKGHIKDMELEEIEASTISSFDYGKKVDIRNVIWKSH